MEVERDHVLRRKVNDEGDIFAAENDLLAEANAGEGASDELEMSFEALGSEARFDRVLFDGGEFGHAGEVHVGSEEEMDFLGIPGLLEPGQMRELLQQRQSDRAKKQKAAPAPTSGQRRLGRRGDARTSSWRSCGASSTGWSPPGTTAPGRRTASPTRRCARSAAARPPRSRPPTSCTRGSTGSATGRPARAPELP